MGLSSTQKAAKLAKLKARQTILETAINNASTGVKSYSIPGYAVNRESIPEIRKELISVEKVIERMEGITKPIAYGNPSL